MEPRGPLQSSADAIAVPGRVLRRLFLTLFLRGRSARGLNKERAPKSVARKLMVTLFFYAVVGLFAALFLQQSAFLLSVYLHAMTFVFVGLFVASSAGEILFNDEEADILLHRPVPPRSLLWAKVAVLVQVSLWLAGAFNLAGFVVGARVANIGWLYPPVHMVSTCLLAVFCTGGVVLVYQLCLRWLGRERLEGLMTTAQVLITMGIILGSQAVPYLIGRYGKVMAPAEGTDAWWVYTLPPAWFAGFDDALAGSGAKGAWMLGGFGVLATATVVGLAFGKLARSYATGWQSLSEARTATPRQRSRRRWLSGWVRRRPMRWVLRDSVTRGSFLLTIAYLLRDRDVKLRLYPGLAPMIVIPLVFLVRDISQEAAGGTSGFGVAFAGGYLGIIPLVGLNLIQYSQQWPAADIFRAAPLAGPARISQGARLAILGFLAMPMLLLLALLVALAGPHSSHWPLLLPGILGLPIYALFPCLNGKGVPLSLPIEEAKSVGQGLSMFGVMVISVGLSGLSMLAWKFGWFWWFLLAEAVAVMAAYACMRSSINNTRWRRRVDGA